MSLRVKMAETNSLKEKILAFSVRSFTTFRGMLKVLRSKLGRFVTTPLLLILLLGSGTILLVGGRTYYNVRSSVQKSLTESLEARLGEQVLRVDSALLYLRGAIHRTGSEVALDDTHPLENLRTVRHTLAQRLEQSNFDDFSVVDIRGELLIEFSHPELQQRLKEVITPALRRALRGQTSITAPVLVRMDGNGFQTEQAYMSIVAPLYGRSAAPEAVLVAAFRPRQLFPSFLTESEGRVLVFERHGYVLSSELDEAGRKRRVHEQISGSISRGKSSSVLLEGYQISNIGEMVGAWKWIEEYGVGVLVQIPKKEAYQSVAILLRSFGALFALLLLSSLSTLLISYLLFLSRRRARYDHSRLKKLGQYVLEERIGKGGMGEVFKARHTLLRRPTAVKLIRKGRVSESSIEQFEREVQLTSKLSHPNTIAIYDFGRTSDQVFYYAMEYLSGFSLSEVVKLDGPQAPARVLYILERLCSSLWEAHSQGLIHRDIKPANVMLVELGGSVDVVKLLDFGLVYDLHEDTSENRRQIVGGAIRFLAPEVAKDPSAVNNLSDIYSLGALGYFLLTGCYVHGALSSTEYLEALERNELTPPSERLGVKIDPTLEKVVLSCLQVDPKLRPQSVKDLARALRESSWWGSWDDESRSGWWARYHHCREEQYTEPANDELSLFVDMNERFQDIGNK